MDESGYYFNMLGLNEEQLFTEYDHKGASKSNNDIICLPNDKDKDIIQLSEEINVTAKVIANRHIFRSKPYYLL